MTKEKGSAIIITTIVKKKNPFGNYEVFDPDTIKLTVTDPSGAAKIDDIDMIKRTGYIGQYYHICQTGGAWATGIYQAKITVTSGLYADCLIQDCFELV